MKAEHRKELHTNALAERLNRVIKDVQQKPSQGTMLVIGGIVLIVLIIVGWRYYSTTSTKSRSAQWLQIDEAMNIDDLDKIIQDHPSSSAARDARFLKVRKLMQEGQGQLYYPDPLRLQGTPELPNTGGHTQALGKIEEAGELYQKLVDETRDLPILAQEALMGTATVHVIKGDFPAAIAAYKEVVKRYPKTFQGERAAKLAQQLEENPGAVQKLEDRLAVLAGAKPPGG